MKFIAIILATVALFSANALAAPETRISLGDGVFYDLVKRQKCCSAAQCGRGGCVNVSPPAR